MKYKVKVIEKTVFEVEADSAEMAEEYVSRQRSDGFGPCTELSGDGAYNLDYEIEEIS
mgnify:CR=1 FL=1